MKQPKTKLSVDRAILPKIHAQEPGVRGLMDLGVYVALLDLAAHEGRCNITVAFRQLAPILGVCRNSFVRSIRRLEAAGALLTAPAGGDGMVITFPFEL